MNSHTKITITTLALLILPSGLLFAEMSSTGKGFLGGAATGAAIGGIAGGGKGAGIGALVGGFAGTAIGASRDDRRQSRRTYRTTRRNNRYAQRNRYCEEGNCQTYRSQSRRQARDPENRGDVYNNPYLKYEEDDAKAF